MSWLSDLFRDTLRPTEREFSEVYPSCETLRPTERELLEAEAAWWKDSARHWREAFEAAQNKPVEGNPYAAKLEADLAERKAARIRQQSEAKQRYWAEQRKRWQCDPLRQSL